MWAVRGSREATLLKNNVNEKKQVLLISDASPRPFSSRLFLFGLIAAINAPPCWNRSAIQHKRENVPAFF